MVLRRVALDNSEFSQFVECFVEVLNEEFLTIPPGDRWSCDRATRQVIHDRVCMSRFDRTLRFLAALPRQPETPTLRSTGVFHLNGSRPTLLGIIVVLEVLIAQDAKR
jgi:hypothetical protein